MKFPAMHLVVMGVAGAGKSTIAGALSRDLGWDMAEADQFHPEANIAKMNAGTPLQDEDRWPWLESIRDWMTAQATEGKSTVLTCSALKHSYRELLSEAEGKVVFIHLNGDPALLGERMRGREGHFMPVTLLPSQLATLEPLTPEELAAGSLRLDITRTPEDLVQAIKAALHLPAGHAPSAS
ncbi:gluconokinase [Arthrobacter oryzae]|uniref:gluconokinase n=1 Tax=Arthrobacter oryzae TaxID=409290 RepID=UPI00273B5C46|nr:gluconokinase [Arthrobacter oryzae]WLQ07438.1 gluconokinase [Arthrobacter oryzae]